MKIQMIIAGIIRVRGCLCWAKFPRDVKVNTSYHLYQGEADDDDELGVLSLSLLILSLSLASTQNGDTGGVPESCSICFDDYAQDQQLRVLPCFHKFHRHCIEKWLSEKQTCPVCQKSIVST